MQEMCQNSVGNKAPMDEGVSDLSNLFSKIVCSKLILTFSNRENSIAN
jgi:hypothetical protein